MGIRSYFLLLGSLSDAVNLLGRNLGSEGFGLGPLGFKACLYYPLGEEGLDLGPLGRKGGGVGAFDLRGTLPLWRSYGTKGPCLVRLGRSLGREGACLVRLGRFAGESGLGERLGRTDGGAGGAEFGRFGRLPDGAYLERLGMERGAFLYPTEPVSSSSSSTGGFLPFGIRA